MPFALINEPSQSEISEAINYLLANFGSNIAADPNTGEISGPSGIVIAYLYRYLAVKYADSFDGSVNFGDSPTNRLYYGLRNTDDPTESTNFADYIWFKVAGGGFGTTKFLWYQANGGRQIDFFIGTAAPSASYLQAPSTSIDLDIVTGTSGKMYAAPTIYIWTANSTPPTRPSTTSTYTWATGAFTPPAGWSAQIPNNTTAGSYLWALAVPLIESVNTVTSVIDWTNVAYPIVSIGINGSTGPDGTRSASGFVYYALATSTAPAAPTLSGFNFTTGTFSSISANWSTTFTAPSATSTTQFWAVRYAVSEATFGGAQTVTVSSVFNWTNFNGLVTFTNLATNTGTTFIDGGNINTNSLNADRISSGNMVSGTASSAWIQMGQSGTVIGTLKSSLNVRKQVVDTTLVNIAAQNNLDGNVTIWGHSANNAVGSGNGVTGSHTADNTFSSWQRLGALGSGLTDSAVWGLAYAPVSTSKGGLFERYTGTDSSSVGTLDKSIQLATNNYCAYSPSGQGKIYIVDGNGPFTGFHEGMIDIADPVEIGDIVVDLSVFYRYNISNVLFQVERSTTANQGGALGVVANRLLVQSSVPGVLWIPESTYTEGDLGPVVNMVLRPEFNLEELQSTYKVLQVNAVGEGQINVCGENGNINAGDLIVCSSIAGKGMKQSDDIVRSISVAKARESVTFSSPTEIQQIACIYISG
jgi:hypothetical protein